MDKRRRYTQESLVDRIKDIHGDKYGYEKVVYDTINTKITLTCKEHGDFQTTPKSIFLQGAGCNKCAYHTRGNSRRKTVEQFIAEAKAIHGDKYDYSTIKTYKNNSTPVTIICPVHGEFTKSPDNHINQKQGCKTCAYKGGKGGYTHSYFQHNPEEQTIPGTLYAVRITHGTEHFIKIGITVKTVTKRFDRSEYKGMDIVTLHERYMPLYDAFCAEQNMIEQLQLYKFFTNTPFSGHTECFRVTPEVLSAVQEVFINNG